MRNFKSASAFASHLARVAVDVVAAELRGLEIAALVIEQEAKSEIGTYQRSDMGPFAPWAELADATKADRRQQGYRENDPGLREGDMRDSIEHSVAPGAAAVGSNDDKLVWFEEGTDRDGKPHQPPRSVLGVAAFRKAGEATEAIGAHVAMTVAGMPVRNS